MLRKILLLFVVVLMLLSTPVQFNRVIAQNSELLSHRNLVNHNISIGGQDFRYVVYYAWDDEKRGSLFVYDLVEKKETLVSKSCNPMLDYQTNCVNEKYFAYLEYTGTSRYIVNILYFETLIVKKIATESAQRFSLNVSGDYASWAEYEDSSNPGVYYCKLNEESPQPIKIHNVTLGTWNYISMSTYQDVTKIVYDDPESGDIYLFDTSNATETKIISNPNLDVKPKIFKGRVYYTNREVANYVKSAEEFKYRGYFKFLDLISKQTETIFQLPVSEKTKMSGSVSLTGLSDKSNHLYLIHNLPQADSTKPTTIIYACDPANNHYLTKIDDNIYEGNKKKCYLSTYQQCTNSDKFVYSKYDKVGDKHILSTFLYSLDSKTKTKIYEIPMDIGKHSISDISLLDNKALFVETTLNENNKYSSKLKLVYFQ